MVRFNASTSSPICATEARFRQWPALRNRGVVFRYGEFNRLMGEAHHFANPGGESCEFGVVVGNKWCKSAIAGLLMGALIRSARTHGLKRMESTVLRTKGAKLRFAHAPGFAVCYSDEDPTTVSIVKIL